MPEASSALRRNALAVGALLQVSVATALQYRSNFLLEMGTGLLNNTARIAPLLLVYSHRTEVGGWDLPHALLVMAFFLLLNGIQHGVFEPNLGAAVDAIRKGTLDLWLMKPVDAQLLISLRTILPQAIWDFISAAAIGAVALSMLDTTPGFADVLLAAGLFCTGVLTMYCLWLLATCGSFWFVRVDNLRFLLWSITDAGRWPIDVFKGALRFLLTAIVPVALITSFPADALRGSWSPTMLATSVAVTAVFVLGSRWLWKRSIASYTSASS